MIVVCLFTALLIAGLDLAIKNWVEHHVESREDRKILGGRCILRKVYNKGMIMNFAEKQNLIVRILSVIAMISVAIIQWILCRDSEKMLDKIGISFVLGGAISNTVDRVKKGYVVDYIAFPNKNKKISRITYNIGDFAIFLGGIMMFLVNAGKK